ncbi:MAG: very short patch repair endonuclease [Terriglobales bacterium]
MDTVDRATRSRYMAAVKSRGNESTEKKMVRLLKRHGLLGWRRHYPLAGTPDFCWPRQRLALFVDGCFWHGCPRCYKTPRSNVRYWKAKVAGNRNRDHRIDSLLRSSGWAVARVWECRLQDKRTLARIRRAVTTRSAGQI